MTVETIHDNYETVQLVDVYAIFSYHLRHRAEVEEYLAEQGREGAEGRRVLVTHDIRTMPDFAHQRVTDDRPMPGPFVVPSKMPIGDSGRREHYFCHGRP